MAKIRMKKPAEAVTLRNAFKEFTTAQAAKGVKDKTLQTYASHFKAAEKHLNMDLTFSELTKGDLDGMIVSMRSAGLAHNSISSYARVLKAFLAWCGGDAFTLQKILGHSTLKMTKHYCTIYDADIARNFDRISPLSLLSQPKEKIKRA